MKRILVLTPAVLACIAMAAGVVQATPPYLQTQIVNASGSPTDNGIALVSMINTKCGGLGDPHEWNPPPGVPFTHLVIKLDPGVYDIGGATLNVNNNCDIEGSGRNYTIIRSTGSGSAPLVTVQASKKSEIRDLTLRNHKSGTPTNGGLHVLENWSDEFRLSRVNLESMPFAVGDAITNHVVGFDNESGDAVIDDLKVTLTDSTFQSWGVRDVGSNAIYRDVAISIVTPSANTNIGIVVDANSAPSFDRATVGIKGGLNARGIDSGNNSSAIFSDAVISVSAGSVASGALIRQGSNVQFKNSTLTANGGSYGYGISTSNSTVQVETSQLFGSRYHIQNSGNTSTIMVGASRLVGPNIVPSANISGVATCAVSYGNNFNPLGSPCF